MKEVDWVLFSVDPVIFTFARGKLSVLLVKRTREPYKGMWALPGGRVDKKNCADLNAALRLKLKEKTGVANVFFEQLSTYGSDSMDPRGWSVTTVYLALVNEAEISLPDNRNSIDWKAIDNLAQIHRWRSGISALLKTPSFAFGTSRSTPIYR